MYVELLETISVGDRDLYCTEYPVVPLVCIESVLWTTNEILYF